MDAPELENAAKTQAENLIGDVEVEENKIVAKIKAHIVWVALVFGLLIGFIAGHVQSLPHP